MPGRLLSWIFPEKCILCGKILKNGETDLCRLCRETAPVYSQGKLNVQFLDSFTAVWYYEESVRRSLLRFKFRGARHYAKSFGRLLAMAVMRAHPEGIDLITWVPVSFLRKLRRGYDQVELIANVVSEELGIPCEKTLKKVRHNRPQSGLDSHPERRANVLGAYRCTNPELTKNKRILLLDDILTTGATAGECARVLLTAGGSEVHCAVVAATRKHKQ
jgi:ComF family protein